METPKKLAKRILAITSQMKKNYPELCVSLPQTPIGTIETINSKLNFSELKQHHDHLIQLLKKYIP